MQAYKEEFIRFLVEERALRFGEFTLKSGRKSPYFVNMGMFSDGRSIRKLGGYFAMRIDEAFGDNFDLLFGPPYKGIALAIATAVAFDEIFAKKVPFAFNRKEAKGHGDAGTFVGRSPGQGDSAIILDDVFTTGETKEEAVEILKNAGAAPAGVVIAVDRGEVGQTGESAIASFRKKYSIPVCSIVDILEIVDYLHGREIAGSVVVDDEMKQRVEDYLREWGAAEFRR